MDDKSIHFFFSEEDKSFRQIRKKKPAHQFEKLSRRSGEIVDYFKPLCDLSVDLAKMIGVSHFEIFASIGGKRKIIARSVEIFNSPPRIRVSMSFDDNRRHPPSHLAAGNIGLRVYFKMYQINSGEERKEHYKKLTDDIFMRPREVLEIQSNIKSLLLSVSQLEYETEAGLKFNFNGLANYTRINEDNMSWERIDLLADNSNECQESFEDVFKEKPPSFYSYTYTSMSDDPNYIKTYGEKSPSIWLDFGLDWMLRE